MPLDAVAAGRAQDQQWAIGVGLALGAGGVLPMREAAEDESGCAAAADGTSCDDENPCTSDDACHSGRCVGVVPEECPTPGQCQVGVCDPTTGACDVTFEPFGTACDDGNGCTDNDFCGVSVCLPGPPHSCDDFDPCTTDACVAGACGHGAVQCPPPSDVCVAPVCRSDFSSGLRGCGFEPITDCCHDDAECDDGNVCTHDACDPGSHRCAHTPLQCWFLTGTTTATASAAGRTVTRRSRLGAALVVDEERRYRLPEFAGCTTDTAVDEIGHFSPGRNRLRLVPDNLAEERTAFGQCSPAIRLRHRTGWVRVAADASRLRGAIVLSGAGRLRGIGFTIELTARFTGTRVDRLQIGPSVESPLERGDRAVP